MLGLAEGSRAKKDGSGEGRRWREEWIEVLAVTQADLKDLGRIFES